jgi:hypothetical protein
MKRTIILARLVDGVIVRVVKNSTLAFERSTGDHE